MFSLLPGLPPRGVPVGMNTNATTIARRLRFDSGALIVPTDLSQGQIARTALSISSADTIRSCPARWASEKLLPTAADPFAAHVIGNAGHDVLEELMRRPNGQRTPDDAADILQHLATTWQQDTTRPEHAVLDDPGSRTRWIAEVYSSISRYWDIEDPNQVDVYATELPVDVTVSGVPIIGFIDRVDIVESKDGERALAIRDYKTGKHISAEDRRRYGDKHGDQIRIYAEALEATLARLPEDNPWHGARVIAGSVLYTRHGKSTKVALSAKHRRETMRAHASAWARHNELTSTGVYPATPSGLCTFCPLVNVCPSRSDRVNWERVPQSTLPAEHLPIAQDSPASPRQSAPAPEHATPRHPEQRLESAPELTGAAHPQVSETKEPAMTVFVEKRPFDADPANIASYAHLSAAALTDAALDQIARAGVPSYALTEPLIRSTAHTLGAIVLAVQEQVTGERDLQGAAARNLQRTLTRLMVFDPMPIVIGGQWADQAQMGQWSAMMVARLAATAQIATSMVTRGVDASAPSHFPGGPISDGPCPVGPPAPAVPTVTTATAGTEPEQEWSAAWD